MQRLRLTEDFLRCIQPGAPRVADSVLPMIAVPSKKTNHINFYLVKREKGKRSAPWEKLGRWPELKLKTIRQVAELKLADRALSQIGGVAGEKAGYQKFETVGSVLSWYRAVVSADKYLSESRQRNVLGSLNKHLCRLNDVSLLQLDFEGVRTGLFNPMCELGYKISYVNLQLKTLRQAFAAAERGGVIAKNPLSTMRLNSFTTAPVRPKTAAFNPGQLKQVVKLIAAEPVYWRRMLAGFSLMYALRIKEACALAWSPQIDLENMLYRVPDDVTKNKKGHILPLTDIAVDLLRQHKKLQRERGHRGNHLFPAARNPRRSVGVTFASDMLSQMFKSGSAHDLRKVSRAWWQENRVDYYVGELMLNHKTGILAETYLQNLLIDSCRDAITLWHEYLMANGLKEAICGKC